MESDGGTLRKRQDPSHRRMQLPPWPADGSVRNASIPPMVNQVEMHPLCPQKESCGNAAFSRRHGHLLPREKNLGEKGAPHISPFSKSASTVGTPLPFSSKAFTLIASLSATSHKGSSHIRTHSLRAASPPVESLWKMGFGGETFLEKSFSPGCQPLSSFILHRRGSFPHRSPAASA